MNDKSSPVNREKAENNSGRAASWRDDSTAHQTRRLHCCQLAGRSVELSTKGLGANAKSRDASS